MSSSVREHQRASKVYQRGSHGALAMVVAGDPAAATPARLAGTGTASARGYRAGDAARGSAATASAIVVLDNDQAIRGRKQAA